MKKCIYCNSAIEDGFVLDFCEKCGKAVFGEKMFKTIINNFEKAKERGDIN